MLPYHDADRMQVTLLDVNVRLKLWGHNPDFKQIVSLRDYIVWEQVVSEMLSFPNVEIGHLLEEVHLALKIGA